VVSGLLATLVTYSTNVSLARIIIGVVVSVASVASLDGIVRRTDVDSVASMRRMLGLTLISTLLWVLPVGLGTIVRFVNPNMQPVANATVFGCFLAWSFEFAVINGIFVMNTLKSFFLAALHPITMLFAMLLPQTQVDGYAVLAGSVGLFLTLLFLLRLRALRTRKGISSLQLLQSFAKTWVVKRPKSLEQCLMTYSANNSVATDAFVAQIGEKQVALVLPGIHPGPFYPVGSYNISELIHEKLRVNGVMGLVLHGMGGHERNLPSNGLAVKYADELARFIAGLDTEEIKTVRGPLRSSIGSTTVTTIAFGRQVLAFISNAPYETDDLDPVIVGDFYRAALNLGVSLSLVDAHNSIGGKIAPREEITKDDWDLVLKNTLSLPEQGFKLGYAHSSEMQFSHGTDISDGGIGILLMVSAGNREQVIITADSNNAAVGLRQLLVEELMRTGVDLVELCTSDSHNLAARRLVNRGYFALGEDTKPENIISLIMNLTVTARRRVESQATRFGRFETVLPLIGQESLDDFAALTNKAVSFAKAFTKLLFPAVLLLWFATLFY
jgi:putative membrane protein